jgi:hypothetical protein
MIPTHPNLGIDVALQTRLANRLGYFFIRNKDKTLNLLMHWYYYILFVACMTGLLYLGLWMNERQFRPFYQRAENIMVEINGAETWLAWADSVSKANEFIRNNQRLPDLAIMLLKALLKKAEQLQNHTS